MKLAALISGGKDSLVALWLARRAGHEIRYLVTVQSENPESYMYHTVNIGATMLQSQAMGIPLVSAKSSGVKEKEVDDLKKLLAGLGVEGVVCGAIASTYQRIRVEQVCQVLGLRMVAPLWNIDLEKYLRGMVAEGFKVIITSVSAEGFDESWLGRELDLACISDLLRLEKAYRINIAGEGGEFETLVLDCPLFSKRIEITDAEKRWEGGSGVYLIKDARLVDKG